MKATKKQRKSTQNSAFKMAKIRCCQNCQNRVIGCHGTCQKYLEERKQLNEYNQKKYEEACLNWYMYDNVKERTKKARNDRAHAKHK